MGASGDICVFNGGTDRIECYLPITLPTSKIRVKRRILRDGREIIEPVAPRRTRIESNDYFEWQISYKDRDTGELVEFGRLLKLFIEKNRITRREICRIIEEYYNLPTFQESFEIYREENRVEPRLFGGDFNVLVEKTPILRIYLEDDDSFIDIVLRHKQRAVGYQSMVFLYIPVSSYKIKPNLVGRTARAKQRVIWTPSRHDITAILRAFMIASEKHRSDMIRILRDQIKIDC